MVQATNSFVFSLSHVIVARIYCTNYCIIREVIEKYLIDVSREIDRLNYKDKMKSIS